MELSSLLIYIFLIVLVRRELVTGEYIKCRSVAADIIFDKVNKHRIREIAENVIFLLGEGLPVGSMTLRSNFDFSDDTYFTGLATTRCLKNGEFDPGCMVTEFLSGVRAFEGTIGVTAAVRRSHPETMNNDNNHIDSLLSLSQKYKKRTGIVTTTRITSVYAAASYAHTANYSWESDADILSSRRNPLSYKDTAQQLIHGKIGKNINIILGGGTSNFLPTTEQDGDGVNGTRKDGRNLIEEWLDSKNETEHQFIHNLTELNNLNTDQEYVLGLFSSNHFPIDNDRVNRTPALDEMTKVAIKMLSRGNDGFFLYIVGGRVGDPHHLRNVRYEFDEYEKTIVTALSMTNKHETLIVAVSSRAHPLTIVSGRQHWNSSNPCYYRDTVTIFAIGPWAHLMTAVTDQYLYHYIITYAACLRQFSFCLHH